MELCLSYFKTWSYDWLITFSLSYENFSLIYLSKKKKEENFSLKALILFLGIFYANFRVKMPIVCVIVLFFLSFMKYLIFLMTE